MTAFFTTLVTFITRLFADIASTISGIVDLCVSGVQAVGDLIGVSAGGMAAIAGVISSIPGSIFFVISASVAVILLIALIRVFVG